VKGTGDLEHTSDTSLLAPATPVEAPWMQRFFSGLRGRLLSLTVGFVLFAVLLIYPILASGYRNTWLREHGEAAQIAALALNAAPDGRVSRELSDALLAQAQVVSVAVVGDDFREMVLAPSMEITEAPVRIDIRKRPGAGSIFQTFGHLLAPKGRFLQIVITPSWTADREMEVIVPEAALRRDLIAFSRDLLLITLVISGVVGALVYFSIYRLVVRPMKGLTDSVIRFGESPEGAEVDFQPGRSDEMQRARDALNNMQQAVSASFRQRKRLADLGEAMAKINHDLRNSLAAAQIVSEGLSQSEDPRVARAAPRLERALERAINLAEATLRYGRADPPTPSFSAVDVKGAVEEAAGEALAIWPGMAFRMEIEPDLRVRADTEHVHRILSNLLRNAARALAEQAGRTAPAEIVATARRTKAGVEIAICDNGPGISDRLRQRLFQPFAATGSRDGTGLGLAISRELARSMGGDLQLADSSGGGARFVLGLPAA
jgi:signal transduction histidine kinase